MRYLKDLIPAEHRVLPDYFKPPATRRQPDKVKTSPLYTLVSIVFFAGAICSFSRPLIAILLILAAGLYTKFGKQWLEKTAVFRLTDRIRIGINIVLLTLCLPLLIYYQRAEAQEARRLDQVKQQRIKFVADSLVSDNLRKDSLSYFIRKVNHEDPQESFSLLNSVEKYALTPSELDTANKLRKTMSSRFAKSLLKKGKAKEALLIYNGLLEGHPNDADVLYERASYYVKVGKLKLAVEDLTAAKDAGNRLASKLYERVNPIRRRVAYYVTRCCDGTTSNAKGRGACSWHGGVCNWNDPVYEEYRKY